MATISRLSVVIYTPGLRWRSPTSTGRIASKRFKKSWKRKQCRTKSPIGTVRAWKLSKLSTKMIWWISMTTIRRMMLSLTCIMTDVTGMSLYLIRLYISYPKGIHYQWVSG